MAKSKATIDELHELHAELAKALTKRIKAGEATAADFREAREMLKDNKVQQLDVPGTPVGDLAGSLPFVGGESYAQ